MHGSCNDVIMPPLSSVCVIVMRGGLELLRLSSSGCVCRVACAAGGCVSIQQSPFRSAGGLALGSPWLCCGQSVLRHLRVTRGRRDHIQGNNGRGDTAETERCSAARAVCFIPTRTNIGSEFLPACWLSVPRSGPAGGALEYRLRASNTWKPPDASAMAGQGRRDAAQTGRGPLPFQNGFRFACDLLGRGVRPGA